MNDLITKKLFGKDIKIIQNCCTRENMSCCGGGGGCCKSLFLHIINQCNASCYFCIEENNDKQKISNFDKLRSVITELVEQKVVSKVVLTGGEPLLHPQFKLFLDILDSYPLQWYSLNTNGILLFDFIDDINKSKLKHINISMHHYIDSINRYIMGACLTFDDIALLRKKISNNIEIRLACTITEHMNTMEDINRYIDKAKTIGVNNVIFRNEYREKDKFLEAYRQIWKDLFTADICQCGYKLINNVHAEYRESDINLKQKICENNRYFRDFIYKSDDMLGGSWEFGSQVIY